jgi:hypothetical protein
VARRKYDHDMGKRPARWRRIGSNPFLVGLLVGLAAGLCARAVTTPSLAGLVGAAACGAAIALTNFYSQPVRTATGHRRWWVATWLRQLWHR